MTDLLQVGIITSTHGLKGEAKVFPTTDDAGRFTKLKKVLLDTGNEKLELEIRQVRFFKKYVIISFKDIDSINDIEKYKGKSLWVTRDNAVELQEDEYFIADILGLTVITDENTTLGILADVLTTGANDVYVVKSPDNKEILLPAIKQCILEVNIFHKYIKIHLMKGLI